MMFSGNEKFIIVQCASLAILLPSICMQKKFSFFRNADTLFFSYNNIFVEFPLPNRWDLIAFACIASVSSLFLIDFQNIESTTKILINQNIILDWIYLPEFAIRTIVRMLIAVFISLVFTFVYGTLAAKSKRASQILIPILDVLQSVPVLGFISITSLFFLSLAPGTVFGAELIAVFALFTSQAWNMTFSFYQSLRTTPNDLLELTYSFRLTAWQRFWKLEVPFAIPGLVRNMMVSMSGGWFFIVASEVVSIRDMSIHLAGLGSFLSVAIDQAHLRAVGHVVLVMITLIILYDQLMFRPILAWSDKFKLDSTSNEEAPSSWLLNVVRRARLLRFLLAPFGKFILQLQEDFLNFFIRVANFFQRNSAKILLLRKDENSRFIKFLSSDHAFNILIWMICLYIAWYILSVLSYQIVFEEVIKVVFLGVLTLLRVIVLVSIASLILVPIAVYIGIHRNLANRVQLIAQILSAFPANVLYPVIVAFIVRYKLNPNIWLSILMMLGAQWYIFFNVIAGASAYPNDFKDLEASFRIRGLQWWRRAILPGIFPYFITGAITATGGAWNASIVAESVNWGQYQLFAHGLGSYISYHTSFGHYDQILLGILIMSIFVITFNKIFWKPIHDWAAVRFRFD